ncbi:MAG TPA: hypothetical protein VFV43_11195, partial [Limnobacter sp.]|nr:hypothetical protein [Limnobacter sp.]
RLIELAKSAGRASLTNSQASSSKLPESDRADMEIFLEKVEQLLPALVFKSQRSGCCDSWRHGKWPYSLEKCQWPNSQAVGVCIIFNLTRKSGRHGLVLP